MSSPRRNLTGPAVAKPGQQQHVMPNHRVNTGPREEITIDSHSQQALSSGTLPMKNIPRQSNSSESNSTIIAAGRTPSTHQPVRGLSGREGSDSRTSNDKSAPKPPIEYGIVFSVKETFGFIQPFQGNEQIYFAGREIYTGMASGQEVSFIKRANSKGYHAERVTLVNESSKQYIYDLNAIIVRDGEGLSSRGTPGLLEFTEEAKNRCLSNANLLLVTQTYGPLPAIPFFTDSATSANSKGPKKVFKGDEVSVTLAFIPGSPYLKASSLNYVRGKRDRMLSEQIQKMLEAGVVREQGVIDTIKGDEYGFIRPVDRNEQIYFRADDAIVEDMRLEAGMEVDFFVIAESVKGKLCDRAVHLGVLPKGSVVFEVTVAEAVVGIVKEEAISSPQEKPGVIELINPIQIKGKNESLTKIDLWQRCLPDDLVLAPGDLLEFDVQHYRPENLYFARSVQIKEYQPLSREYGSICSVKEHGFGFIKSYIRDADLYFRTGDVRDEITGKIVPESALTIDQIVSFNLLLDDSSSFKGASSSSSKLKAIRVQICSDNSVKRHPKNIEELRVSLIKKDIRGVILRDAVGKREAQPGQIEIDNTQFSRLREEGALEVYHAPELIDQVKSFIANPVISEISIKYLTPSQRKAIHLLIDDLYSGVISHLSVDLSKESYHVSDPSKGKALIISKSRIVPSNSVNNEDKDNAKGSTKLSDDNIVLYQKQDANELYGPLAKGLEVNFDLYIDKKTLKKVARNVCLTDDPVHENEYFDYNVSSETKLSIPQGGFNLEEGVCIGVIESVVDVKSGRFGYIRRIPTDEKLFWHSSSITADLNSSSSLANIDCDAIRDGQEVSFKLRRRGNNRCATDLVLLPPNSLNVSHELDGTCIALIVDAAQAVLVDACQCPVLHSRLWKTDKLSATSTGSQKLFESDAKYYPAIGRTSAPVHFSEHGELKEGSLPLGSYIICRAVVNWAKSRHPISFVSPYIERSIPSTTKLQGVITKVKIKGDSLLIESNNSKSASSAEQTLSTDWNGLEFCEIQVSNVKKNENNSNEISKEFENYYCLMSELLAKSDSSSSPSSEAVAFLREGIQPGDKVDFYPAHDRCVALYPVLQPKIQYRRPENKSAIASTGKVTGVQSIIMAKGPPNDSVIGFEAGWRDPPSDISSLPWAHLFMM